MSTGGPPRVVFDCNVFLQALIQPTGPSGACVASAFRGDVILFISRYVLEEVREVSVRPAIASRFGIREDNAALLLDNVAKVAVLIADVPIRYEHPYDPDDSHYVNLALAADARLVVSRDRDLLNLMEIDRPEAQDFRARFPQLRIIDPVEMLRELRPV